MSQPHTVDAAGQVAVTYIGGPTALIEFHGLRFLTDPTFDPPGEYPSGPATLRKNHGPALRFEDIAPIDFVLLSHDQHSDNLDRSGREVLAKARTVLTTQAGAERLRGNAVGLVAWATMEVKAPDGTPLLITATPARHGPVGCEGRSGPVIGFAIRPAGDEGAVYVSGDTVWYEGVAEVARWLRVTTAILNMGAARVEAAGPAPLTMTATDGVELAKAMPETTIVPLHFDGWAHFTESKQVIQQTFKAAGLEHRLRWVDPPPTAADKS